MSAHGFLARSTAQLPDHTHGMVRVHLGADEVVMEQAMLVRRAMTESGPQYGFRIEEPGSAWRRCIRHLEVRDTPRADGRVSVAADETGELWTIDSLAAA